MSKRVCERKDHKKSGKSLAVLAHSRCTDGLWHSFFSGEEKIARERTLASQNSPQRKAPGACMRPSWSSLRSSSCNVDKEVTPNAIAIRIELTPERGFSCSIVIKLS